MPVYLNEKTKKYYCSFYYTDWQGKRLKKKKEGFTLARDAKAWEQDFLNKTAGNCEMKFSALFEYFISDYKARHRPTTATNRELALRKHALPYFADMPLSAIPPVMVRNWQNSLITAGYKATYQRSLNGYLKVMFNFAVKYYKLKENPVTLAGAIGAGKAGLINFWTVSEFYTFLDKLQTGEPLARRRLAEKVSLEVFLFAFNVLFYTGIRLGELLALTVSDYNPTAKSISINKSYAYINGKALILPPKTPKSKRIINIPAKLCAMFDTYIARMYEPQSNERLFPMLNKYNIAKTLKDTAAAAGLKPIRLHDLRHSHASMVINLNYSPKALAERLGHEDVKVTLNIYGHLYPNKDSELAEKLNNLMP